MPATCMPSKHFFLEPGVVATTQSASPYLYNVRELALISSQGFAPPLRHPILIFLILAFWNIFPNQH